LVEVGEHAQIEGRQVAEEQVGAARQPAAVDSRGALIATVHLRAEAGVEQAEIALDRVPRLRSAGSAAVEQVEQRSAGGNQHLVLELVAVVEVEEPPAAAVWAPATAGSHEAAATRAAGAAAGAARTATGAARRRSAGSEDHGRSAPPGALALGAFALAGHWRAAELRAHLVDPLGIDLTVGALEPLEHLRRQGRELLFGDRGRLLAWLTAELLPQLREALRIAECVVAHLRAHFGPALRIDRTVGVLDPVEHRLRQAFEVGRGRHGIGSLGRAETR